MTPTPPRGGLAGLGKRIQAAAAALRHMRGSALIVAMMIALIAFAGGWWASRWQAAGDSWFAASSPPTGRANHPAAKPIATDTPTLADQQRSVDAARGFIAGPSGQIRAADGRTVWDFDRFAFLDQAAPETAHPALWRHARLNNRAGLYKVADGVHQLRGFDLANLTLIDGKTGWIVVDTLTTRETAAAALAFARLHLGNKPVSAIVFTHSHVDHFGGAHGVLDPGEAVRRQVPIVAPAGFMDEATSENILLGPAMGRRATFQFGSQLPASPRGLIDSGLGKALPNGQIDILAPTILVDRTPQAITLDGVQFVFQHVPDAEAPAELAFYLPDLKAFCGAELLSQTLHNLYTLRGAKVRDALKWSGHLDEALQRFGQAEVVFTSHHWPVWGNTRVLDFIRKHRDAYRYLHDQSVRMMNAGLKPDEIAETLQLPASLAAAIEVQGFYGTVRHNARAVYQHYLGWYDGNPALLDPLPRRQAAARYVALMGGADTAVAAGQAAHGRGEFRWAAELLNQVVFAEPDHRGAREWLARSHEQLAYAAQSASWRNAYLSAAHELRSGQIPSGHDPAMAAGLLRNVPVARYLDAMAASLNGPRADGVNLSINLILDDVRQSHVLWIENAVLHHRAAPPDASANATLRLTQPLFIRLISGQAGISEALLDPDFKVSGSRIDLLRFFSLIDKPPRTFAVVTP